tara:strand:+ start:3339 stop:4892 length:1554 start_codon:yes stop_codon:yes gene_type:complete
MRSKRGSYSSPRGSRRACLCKDGATYSRRCCDGELINQGIGSVSAPSLGCQDLTLSGFSVSIDGTITLPVADVGTITATTPASFAAVDASTERNLTVSILVPSNYSNAGTTIQCTATATQPATPTLSCSDITLSGFAVAQNGTVTLPTADIGTISSTNPASFVIVDVSTVRTLNVDITVPSGYFNTGATLNCTTTATQPLTATLVCGDITISGFAVDENGAITLPTLNIGTISSSSPSSYATVFTNTVRTLNLDITVPAGYFNGGSTLACTTTATQPPYNVLDCSEVTISGFDLYASGRYNSSAVSVDIGTIDSMSPGSFATVTTETTRTLTVNITVPGGYSNAGQTIACTTTSTQLPIFYFDQQTPSSGTYVELEPIINTGTSTYAFSAYANDPVTGKTNAFALMNQLGDVIAGQTTGSGSTYNLGNVRISFYSPSDVLLAQYRSITGTFIYTTPDDLSSVPSSPYGGNASNWTSYKMVFTGITSVAGTAVSSPNQETMIDNNSDAGYYWVIEDLG